MIIRGDPLLSFNLFRGAKKYFFFNISMNLYPFVSGAPSLSLSLSLSLLKRVQTLCSVKFMAQLKHRVCRKTIILLAKGIICLNVIDQLIGLIV